MGEKLVYDKKRHRDIRIDGKKAKMLGCSFFTHHHDGAACILLKTKIPGNYPQDLARQGDEVHLLELPREEGNLVIRGKLRTIASSPTMAEYGFEILSKEITP